MPTYQWTGINLQGQLCRGIQQAASPASLEKILIDRDIAVISTKPAQQASIFQPRWKLDHTIEFLKQLAALVQAGIFLPDALEIISSQESFNKHRVVQHILTEVKCGTMLSEAFTQYPALFDAVAITLIKVGEDTGKVAPMIELLVLHLEQRQSFKQRLRAAALTPLITLTFFLVIASVIIGGVIPQFALLIEQHTHQLPTSTQWLLWISQHLNAYTIGLGSIMSIVLASFFNRWRQRSGKEIVDELVLYVPFFGSLIQSTAMLYLLEASSMLLAAQVPLPDALARSQEVITNQIIKLQWQEVVDQITQGQAFSAILTDFQLLSPDVTALIRIGEETNKLDAMIQRGAELYQRRISQRLDFVATIFQPLLMILLGLLVAALVVAVYVPIFDLAQGIGI